MSVLLLLEGYNIKGETMNWCPFYWMLYHTILGVNKMVMRWFKFGISNYIKSLHQQHQANKPLNTNLAQKLKFGKF